MYGTGFSLLDVIYMNKRPEFEFIFETYISMLIFEPLMGHQISPSPSYFTNCMMVILKKIFSKHFPYIFLYLL